MTILLAVSGGIDSMYMANRAPELFPGARFAVAHCNFQLRGGEADEDEAFVRDWCSSKGITFHSTRFDTATYAGENHVSIEMAARTLRYEWFRQLCAENGYDAVATAHNANDNAETMLLNLLRGTGTRGLRGMSSEGTLLRPLLGTTREEIHEWMTGNGLPWREDRTNSENEYKRNIIRNEVFPVFRRINPSVVRTLNADAERIAQVDDIARDYVERNMNSVTASDGSILIPELLELKHWQFMLWALLENTGIGRSEFKSLTEALSDGRQTAGKTFGPVTAASGRLVIRSKKPVRMLKTETAPYEKEADLKQPQGVIIMDAGMLPEQPVIRKWQPGDWMRPLGMKGRKKVSDILTGMKLSVSDKEDIEVIELDGSHVAAILCCRIDESVKVTGKTRLVTKMYYSMI